MPGFELFGAAAVSAMVVFYALEHRSPSFILLFALACLASSAYAVAIRSWPFAVVELLWAGIAARRWLRAPGRPLTSSALEHVASLRAPVPHRQEAT
jgi:hypothetical protein